MTRAGFRLLVVMCVVFLVSGCASDKEKTQTFLNKGQAAYDAGQYNEAVIQIKNAIELTPKSLAAHRLLSQVYLKLGDARQTFSTLLKIEQLAPEDLDNTARVASFYLLGRQVEEARRRVDDILSENPDHIQALYLKAGILSNGQENLPKIKEIYSRILALNPQEARAHLALARIFGAENDFAQAESHLIKAKTITPDSINIYKTLFDFYMTSQHPDKGLAVLKELVQQHPDQADPHIFLGNFYQGRGQSDKAVAEFKAAIEKDKTNINARMRLARLLNARGDAQEAEAYIRQAMELEPDNYTVKTAYAEFHFTHGNIDSARKLVDETLAARPDFLPAKVLYGKLLVRDREFEKAVLLFSDLVKEEPDSPAYHFLLGSALFDKGDTAQAKASLATAIEKNPRHISARVMLATIHYGEQDYDLALDHLLRVLELAPDHYQANLILGNVRMAQNKNKEARQIFDRLVTLNPANPTAFYRLGILDRAEKKYKAAETHLKQALNLNSTLMDVFSALVSVYAVQEKFDQALETIDDHLKAHSDHGVVASVLMNLKGTILLSKNDWPKAEAAYKKAIEQNPRYVPPYLTLAKMYGSRKNWDAVEKTYLSLIENRPDQAMAHGLLGSLYERDGKLEQAETQYLKALEIDPDHIQAVNNLAYLYAEQDKQLNKALDLARQAKKRLGQVPAIMDTLGWVYYKKELFDSAAAEFESCVALSPRNPVFHYHLGLAYHRLGKTDKARDALNKALDLSVEFSGADHARSVLGQL